MRLYFEVLLDILERFGIMAQMNERPQSKRPDQIEFSCAVLFACWTLAALWLCGVVLVRGVFGN